MMLQFEVVRSFSFCCASQKLLSEQLSMSKFKSVISPCPTVSECQKFSLEKIIDICLEKANLLNLGFLSEFFHTDYRIHEDDFQIQRYVRCYISLRERNTLISCPSLQIIQVFLQLILIIDCFDLSVYQTTISKRINKKRSSIYV